MVPGDFKEELIKLIYKLDDNDKFIAFLYQLIYDYFNKSV